MEFIKIPAFGETVFSKNIENKHSTICTVSGAEEQSFFDYKELYLAKGFTVEEEYLKGTHRFAALRRGDDGAFINYFGGTGEISVVEEKESKYFSFSDNAGTPVVAPQITQVFLEDYGLSYVIRLSDGRFILIDGGFGFEPDIDRLYDCLLKGSEGKRPKIAAWIMSHPHEDHYRAYICFMEKYGTEVDIESYLFNFPDHDDLFHYPSLEEGKDTDYLGDVSAITNVPIMIELMKKSGAPIYTPHTGQTYNIGDARLEFFATIGDTIHVTRNLNATSLVFKMALGGQTALFTTDSGASYARLPERYGEYLRSDFLQIPHHGFSSGKEADEIAMYELVAPKVCLLPVSDYCAYTYFCIHRKGMKHIMHNMDVREMISGDEQKTITLPYIPSASKKEELRAKYSKGLENCGARTWVFTDLSTSEPEDLRFTLLNMTVYPVTVYAELFFEKVENAVRFVKIDVGGVRLRTVSLAGDDVDPDFLLFNRASLKLKGIPENSPFAVRFISEDPIVISNKLHKETYRSTISV